MEVLRIIVFKQSGQSAVDWNSLTMVPFDLFEPLQCPFKKKEKKVSTLIFSCCKHCVELGECDTQWLKTVVETCFFLLNGHCNGSNRSNGIIVKELHSTFESLVSASLFAPGRQFVPVARFLCLPRLSSTHSIPDSGRPIFFSFRDVHAPHSTCVTWCVQPGLPPPTSPKSARHTDRQTDQRTP